jgi:hypothetical protein
MTTRTRVAIAFALSLVAASRWAASAQAPETRLPTTAERPLGVRILSDVGLFPREPAGAGGRILIDRLPEPARPDVLARLDALSTNPSSQRTGHVSTAIMSGYAPTITSVIQKYGKADRIVEESRDLGDTPDRVYYWGRYGLALRSADTSDRVAWVRLRLR